LTVREDLGLHSFADWLAIACYEYGITRVYGLNAKS